MYETVTSGVRVSVTSDFLPEHSEPDDGHFFWSYTVEIANETSETMQLMSRHWQIIDGKGERSEVRGEGVVGEQPILTPGASFRYTSGVPLSTSSGFMSGTYHMILDDGRTLDVAVPTFSLDTPEISHTVN